MLKYNFSLERLKELFKIKRKDKKDGFTLIELVTVLAVISILSAALIPKIGNYVNESKKVAVLNEAKTVVTAYEGARYRINSNDTNTTISILINEGHLESEDIKKIDHKFSVAQCKNLMDTENYTFDITSEGVSEPKPIANSSKQ